ncbi:carboxylesterase 1E-like [Bolinopsis microptera]|uniref:carboxylesterase 1E-like n=1 Tax=Bolinopsis microptera TaxID=2820187 RepID=UPI003079ED78
MMNLVDHITILVLLVAPSLCSDVVTVGTSCERVNGSVVKIGGRKIYEFHQMPYAEPPVGDLRWTHSKPISREHCVPGRVYDATKETRTTNPIKCVNAYDDDYPEQVVGVEDCLYLTVRSPSLEPNASLPVLVWIHGGSLKTGYSDYPGYAPDTEFTDDLRVVTVNINYRLEVFGFFSSPDIWDDPENPGNFGNFGIGDAITALQWVQENIVNFGGDLNSVTILGESSGGTVVLGLLGSEKADGLFHKAISLSAPPLWKANPQSAYEKREDFAKKVGCTQGSAGGRRRCLKSKPVLDLIRNRDLNRGWGFYDFPYADGEKGESMDYNVLDNVIVQSVPFKLAYMRRKQNVKVIIGNTAQETGANAIDYDTNKVASWQEAKDLLGQKIDKFQSERPDIRLNKYNLLRSIMMAYDYRRVSSDWWPQIFFDTLTTDVRTTCLNNMLVKTMNSNRNIDAYRLYIKSRPNEIKCGTPWSTIHGWDTEALFGYGYYGPFMEKTTISDVHQKQFKDNMRQLVASFCYDRISDSWNTETALIMENDGFPNSVRLSDWRDPFPQSSECKVWEASNLLKFGWQN